MRENNGKVKLKHINNLNCKINLIRTSCVRATIQIK